jgi:flagellar assembly factor FliW
MVSPLGDMHEGNTYVLVTVTVPHKKAEDFSVNLKAPVVINMDTLKGVQLIVEDDYPVKYKVYEILKNKKAKAGEAGC